VGLPDLVIPVRPGESNQELRYALRSFAQNLPHRRIVIAGYKPSWLRNVLHIPVRQRPSKYASSTANLLAACRHAEVSDDFLLCNDDFYVLAPIEQMPVYHRGPVSAIEAYYRTRANGAYLQGMRATRDLLVKLGHDNPISYELHVPMPMNKHRFLEIYRLGKHIPVLHKRTLYGNVAGLGGTRLRDPKVVSRTERFGKNAVFLSTMDSSWLGPVGAHIRAAFPRPCRYEGRLTSDRWRR
jgi:hypothetical protein